MRAQRNLLAGNPFEVTAMSRQLLTQRAKELCVQISTEKNRDRMLALVTELNDVLQNHYEQKPPAEMQSDQISFNRLPQSD